MSQQGMQDATEPILGNVRVSYITRAASITLVLPNDDTACHKEVL